MGMMNCKKHGRVGAAHSISKKLCGLIRDENFIDTSDVCVITVSNYEGDKFLFNSTCLATSGEIKKWGLEVAYKVVDDISADLIEKNWRISWISMWFVLNVLEIT